MKNKYANILIVALLLLAIVSVMLVVFLTDAKEKFPEKITVDADGVTESILPVRDLRLNPTESKEYSVNLVCIASGSYHIYVDYEESDDGGMKHFVEVTLKFDGETVYEGSLAELIDSDKTVQFDGELEEDEAVAVSFCYRMPDEVGNEAQGTYADFEVVLRIEKS